MKREQRLRRPRDFSAAYRAGRAHGNHLLVVRVRPNGGEPARFGFAVGKVVGNAVMRNRVKRRLREIARRLEAKPGNDVVVGARASAASATFDELERAFVSLMRRHGALAATAADAARESD